MVHEAFSEDVIFRMPPFNDVTRQREGSTGEPDQRNLSFQFLPDDSNRLHEKRGFLFWFDDPQFLHFLHLPERMMKNRAFPFCKLKFHSHGLQWDEDI